MRALWRSKKNKIKRLKKLDGSWCTDQAEMRHIAQQYFEEVFTRDDCLEPEELVNLVEAKVTDEMNLSLCKPYSDEETSDALFQIGPLKAPGPDGFPARFFQRNWEILREDVTRAVKDFFLIQVLCHLALMILQ